MLYVMEGEIGLNLRRFRHNFLGRIEKQGRAIVLLSDSTLRVTSTRPRRFVPGSP